MISLLIRAASACSYLCEMPELPADGATEVPTNTLVFSGKGLSDQLILLNAEATPVASTRQEPLRSLSIVRPLTPLEPFTRHELWRCDGAICTDRLRVFTTGAGPDDEAPGLPIERSLTIDRNHDPFVCGAAKWTVDIEIEQEAELTFLDIGEASTFDPDTFDGEVSDITDWGGFNLNGPCGASLPFRQRGDTTTLRYAAMDASGNFSGWTEPTTLALQANTCGHLRGGTWILGVLGLLSAVGWRRSP